MSQRPTFGCLFEILETLVLTVVIFWLIQTFIAQPYKVQQTSMEQTLEEGQYVLVDKLTPRWSPYARGDIVVFKPPASWQDGSIPFIKRVIGLPGDTIELRDGLVYVNGEKLEEPYLYAVDGIAQPTEPTVGGQSRWLVPEGDLFVMGDHRENSSDSRTFGPIGIGDVAGRAWLRYWPFDVFQVLPHPGYPNLASASP